MTEFPLKDARDQLGSIVLDVQRTREPAVITRYGHPEAVIIGFEDWQELEALRDAADMALVRERMADGQKPIPLDEALRQLDAA
ncbi:type II toxin-antitoxin system Phd/YefM family antitoxin [Longispora albida]|uniref:type II toxin-antitoxin system Phd/YefM family antitoxin n=1 Tax=Longispora albida TaxID=203523 RepID=UPI000376E901|nr:type II toxin-antitoxin system Phd/YefM family antitoxin [Longispora albida]